jgi:hypothetical protein
VYSLNTIVDEELGDLAAQPRVEGLDEDEDLRVYPEPGLAPVVRGLREPRGSPERRAAYRRFRPRLSMDQAATHRQTHTWMILALGN